MRIDRSFLAQVGTAVVLVWGIAAYPFFSAASGEIVTGAALGTALSVLNVLGGMATVAYSFDRSYSTFLKVVLGGMGIRMGLLLGIMFVLIKVFEVHALALIISLLWFYLIFLIMEIFSIQRIVESRNRVGQ